MLKRPHLPPADIEAPPEIFHFLQDKGIPLLPETMTFAREREYSRVWHTELQTDYGLLSVEVIVFELGGSPAARMAYQEEVSILHGLANREPRWSRAPDLVEHGVDKGFAFLITVPAGQKGKWDYSVSQLSSDHKASENKGVSPGK